MSTDATPLSHQPPPNPYTESIGQPLILLLKHTPGTSACDLLWRINQLDEKGYFTLSLYNPVSEMQRVLSVRCISGKPLDTDWDISIDFTSTRYSSEHPCNIEYPPCLERTIPPPVTPITHKYSLSQRVIMRLGSKQQPRKQLARDSPSEMLPDTEIPELTLLRASLPLKPDLRAYRVIIEAHRQRDVLGRDTIFCVTLSFGRCTRGQNMLSLRCPTGDNSGLSIEV